MSYETAARRANGNMMTSRLADDYEDAYQTASDAIRDEIKDNFKKCPDDLAHLLAAVQERELEKPDDQHNLLNIYPWLKLDFHRGKAHLRPAQAQLVYASRDMEPDEFFITTDVEAEQC